jgi:hypothetical protein
MKKNNIDQIAAAVGDVLRKDIQGCPEFELPDHTVALKVAEAILATTHPGYKLVTAYDTDKKFLGVVAWPVAPKGGVE